MSPKPSNMIDSQTNLSEQLKALQPACNGSQCTPLLAGCSAYNDSHKFVHFQRHQNLQI